MGIFNIRYTKIMKLFFMVPLLSPCLSTSEPPFKSIISRLVIGRPSCPLPLLTWYLHSEHEEKEILKNVRNNIKKNPTINHVDLRGATLLDYAIRMPHDNGKRLAQLLIHHGGKTHYYRNWSPLMIAIKFGDRAWALECHKKGHLLPNLRTDEVRKNLSKKRSVFLFYYFTREKERKHNA